MTSNSSDDNRERRERWRRILDDELPSAPVIDSTYQTTHGTSTNIKGRNNKSRKKVSSHNRHKTDVESILTNGVENKNKKSYMVSESKLHSRTSHDNHSIHGTADASDDVSLFSMYSSDTYNMRNGMSSHRSIGSADSNSNSIATYASTSSLSTIYRHVDNDGNQRNLKDVIIDLQRRVKKDQPPPEYINTINQLPVSMFSWNKRPHRIKPLDKSVGDKDSNYMINNNLDSNSSVMTMSPSSSVALSAVKLKPNPIVNIIGVHHSIDLIIAKADDRMRKRDRALKLKQRTDSEYDAKLGSILAEKSMKLERYAQERLIRQRRNALLIILHQFRFVHHIRICYNNSILPNRREIHMRVAATRITRSFKHWYQRRMKQLYTFSFKKSIRNNQLRLGLSIRVIYKRIAVRRIKSFLVSCQANPRFRTAIQTFIIRVRKIQRILRTYLACRAARLHVLSLLWEKWEKKYIKRKLLERFNLCQGTSSNANSSNSSSSSNTPVKKKKKKKVGAVTSFNSIKIAPKMKAELEKQAQRWLAVDDKMSKEVKKNTDRGYLKVANDNDTILKYLLAVDIRNNIISVLLKDAKKRHLRDLAASAHKEAEAIVRRGGQQYSSDHALHLLKDAKAGYIDSVVIDTLSSTLPIASTYAKSSRELFYMHKCIPVTSLIEAIKQAHDDCKTFVIIRSPSFKETVTISRGSGSSSAI